MSFFNRKEQVTFTTDQPSVGRKIWRSFLELVQVAAIVTAIVLPIRYFLVQPFYVKGASMEPNFNDHEYLVIDEISYRLRDPQRGEIVVFRYPNDPGQFFIKRIIGLPGDTVAVSGGAVRITSPGAPEVRLEEAYLDPGTETAGDKTLTLGTGQYFVMGDNRGASLDSRIFGPVERKAIVGRVMLRGWPLDKLSWFETPTYQVANPGR